MDVFGVNFLNDASLSRYYGNAGVDSRFIFHTCRNYRSFCFEKRNSLLLHVGAHERSVRVVVFEERNHSRRNGYDHLGRNVHIVNFIWRYFKELVSVADSNPFGAYFSVFVKRSIRLGYFVSVLDVCRHVFDFFCDSAGGFVNFSVRSLNKSVFIYSRERRKRRYKSYVRSFGSLYGAHSSIVRMVNVSNLKSRSVPRKTAGT